MIYDFLNKLDPKHRDAIYSINEQDGLEFEFQIADTDNNEFFYCYKMTYIKFEDGSETYSIESVTDSKSIWTEGIEYMNEYLSVLRNLDWAHYE